jgi:hypothetical protein
MSMNEIKRYLVSEKKYNITPAVNKMQAPLVQEVFHQMGEMVLYPDHLAALAAKDAEWKKWAEVELAANDEKWQKVLAQSISTSNANVAAAQDEIERLRAQWEEMRDCVLNERDSLAESGMTSDQINAVLGVIDDHAPAARAKAADADKQCSHMFGGRYCELQTGHKGKHVLHVTARTTIVAARAKAADAVTK